MKDPQLNLKSPPRAADTAQSSNLAKLPLRKIITATPELFALQKPAPSAGIQPIAYEWFYLEICSGQHHAVCIFSLRDPFSSAKSLLANPASVYFTWYEGGELQEYAYNFFEGIQSIDFCAKLSAWMSGETDVLELWLTSHGCHRLCQVKLAWPASVPRDSGVQATPFPDDIKHIWQLLAQAGNLSGAFVQHDLDASQRKLLRESTARCSLFFDVPLALSLHFKPSRALKFHDAHLYFDHNAGTEPLQNMGHNWFWWHTQTRTTPAQWQVGYAFPAFNSGYLCTQKEGVHFSEVVPNFNQLFVPTSAVSSFGVEHPIALTHSLGGTRRYSSIIENAPFYCRRAFETTTEIGTLEFLSATRLAKEFNQRLLSARRLSVLTSQKTLANLAYNHDFHKVCALITATHGKSFYLASHILGKQAKQRAYFVYTLCRMIDDATDNPAFLNTTESSARSSVQVYTKHEPQKSLYGAQGSLQLIDALWNERFHADPFPAPVVEFLKTRLAEATQFENRDNLGEKNLSQFSAAQFLACASALIADMNLDRALYEELASGQEMDEVFVQPRNFDELYVYCFKVAGVVGHMMARVLNADNTPKANKAAEHLGIAMQITNILRDIREDAARGRNYLPSADLELLGLQKHVRQLALQGVSYYQSALSGLANIPTRRGRLCVKLMSGIYGAILGKILEYPNISLQKRVVIPKLKRLVIAGKVLLGQSPLSAAGLSAFVSDASIEEIEQEKRGQGWPKLT